MQGFFLTHWYIPWLQIAIIFGPLFDPLGVNFGGPKSVPRGSDSAPEGVEKCSEGCLFCSWGVGNVGIP